MRNKSNIGNKQSTIRITTLQAWSHTEKKNRMWVWSEGEPDVCFLP